MTSIYNYAEAARRHEDDGKLLESAGHAPGADHFYGLSAECALLGALASLQDCTRLFNADGSIDQKYQRHINVLWREVLTLLRGRRSGGYFSALTSAYRENPFHDWHILQRYHSNAALAGVAVQKHRDAAAKCIEALAKIEAAARNRAEQEASKPAGGTPSANGK